MKCSGNASLREVVENVLGRRMLANEVKELDSLVCYNDESTFSYKLKNSRKSGGETINLCSVCQGFFGEITPLAKL